MGCLLEMFFEIFVEGIFELIGYCYTKLMTLIVPDKTVSDRTKKRIKRVATAVAGGLGILLVIGLILQIQEDPFIKNIGRYATYVSLAMMALQVVLGIIMKTVSHLKRK